jgi:parvulin-like peptidyl-prolyl isomerase
MSPTNDATVPPHLTNSGIIDEPSAVRFSRTPALHRLLPMVIGGAVLFVLGLAMGSVLAHRNDDAPLATVNGIPIDQKAYNHRCETVIANNAAIGQQVMRQMVMDELALQYAAKQGVTPTEAEIDQKYNEAIKGPNFADNLKKSLQTQDDLKRAVKVQLAQTNVITKGVTVTDDDIKAFYKQNTDPKNPQARYYTPDAVQIAAIISDKEADINSALHDLASGAAFAQVAQKYSKDKSGANGGLLPAIRRGTLNNQKFPGLENQLFSLKTGMQADKIKVGSTFWLVRCVGRSLESSKPFDQVKEECREGALLTKGINANGKNVQADYQNFIKSADIKAVQPQYKDAVNITVK